MAKADALARMMCEINSEIKGTIQVAAHGYVAQRLSGYVFLCVDSIELRREIAKANKNNPYIKAMFDFRTRLTDAQHYAAETPVSACNVILSVAPTIRMICALGVTNFVNFVKGDGLKKFIQIDAFKFILDAF